MAALCLISSLTVAMKSQNASWAAVESWDLSRTMDKSLLIFNPLMGMETTLPIVDEMILELKLTPRPLATDKTMASERLRVRKESNWRRDKFFAARAVLTFS